MRHLILPVLTACAATEPPPDRPYPDAFLWGSATAGFQVEMGCPTWSDERCIDDASDWYAWVTDPGIVGDAALHVQGEDLRHGPGMWELFEEDVARMSADGHTSYRMSIEWSRLFPTDAESATTVDDLDDLVNADAQARYREMLDALAAAGIEPLVTVNHYVLPTWVHDGVACHDDLETCPARGWIDGERMTRLMTLYASWLARTYGDHVDRWATLNEPFATTLSGYLQPGEDRSAPPGRSFDGESVVASIRHQIEAHASMYDALHEHDAVDASGDGVTAEVGLVLNMVDAVPADPDDPNDVAATVHADHLYHRLFLDGVTTGSWDDDLDGTWDRTRPELADRLDYLGVNYYNQMRISWIPVQLFGDLVPSFDFFPEFTWDPHPEGLARVVEVAATYGRPIIVTENGTPHTDISDRVLTDHLSALHDAITAGADVRGYFYWSFVDNYEWNHGLDLRFGLYALDVDSKARTRRPVADVLSQAAVRNGLDEPQ